MDNLREKHSMGENLIFKCGNYNVVINDESFDLGSFNAYFSQSQLQDKRVLFKYCSYLKYIYVTVASLVLYEYINFVLSKIPVRVKGGRRRIRKILTEQRIGTRSQHRRQAPSLDEFYARNDCRRDDALEARALRRRLRAAAARVIGICIGVAKSVPFSS